MDIRWKDGEGNILNANKNRIIYLESSVNTKTIIKNEEVKKITIEDGLMNIFRDFENDLIITIVIPKKNTRNAVKIFNEYDKTGIMLKRKSGNIMLDLILESSVITGNPLTGILAFLFIALVVFSLLLKLLGIVFGEYGHMVARFLIAGSLIYVLISYIALRIKRKSKKV